MSDELSSTMRDYLAELYRLSDRNNDPKGYVSTSALAELMDVSAPAVNRMVNKLREMGLLLHEPYQGINLTEKGEKQALYTLRNQRIAESFLVTVMGFGWHEVFEEAQRMSASLSEALAQRMAEMAGHPTHCPHGEPIPSVDGTLPEQTDIMLSEANLEKEYVVSRVLSRESDRLEYIAALGLIPNKPLHVIHKAPFNGPIQLKVGQEYRIIGHSLAELIRIKTT